MAQQSLSLHLVGVGKMGGALLRGWLNQKGMINPATSVVSDPHPDESMKQLLAKHGIRFVSKFQENVPDVVVLAVKPQKLDEAIAGLEFSASKNTLFLSIAAGRSITSLKNQLPKSAAIIRAMPNLPAEVGEGASVMFADLGVSEAHKNIAESLFSCVGQAIWMKHENQIDAATALSGSGPAYIFLLTEYLTKAGTKVGLSPEDAAILARQMVIGAGAMLKSSPDSPADLRKAVTSPAGTTEAALKVLIQNPDGLEKLVIDAVSAANSRAAELKF